VTERIDEKDRITGNIVCAKVTPRKEENHKEFTKRIKKHCSQKLERFKVPVKIVFIDENQYGERFKKKRKSL